MTRFSDSEGHKYWRAQEEDDQIQSGKCWYYRPVSADVETTAYALMTTLMMNGEDKLMQSLPIVRWLSKQRNGNGGFGSTQVTACYL